MTSERYPPPFLNQWGPTIGLCLTLLLVSYNIAVVPPIMPPMVRQFDSNVGYVQGALVLMSLVTASFTPTAENLSRSLGRKPMFTVAMGVFALGVIVVILSPNMGIFTLGFAVITGLAAAVLVSTPWALMDQFYDDMAEQYAMLALTVSGVVGGLLGSLLGGLMAFQFSWRWAFGLELLLIPVILGLVQTVPPAPPRSELSLDWFGGLLSFLGFGLTLMGISLAGEYGWWYPKQTPQLFDKILTPFGVSIVPVLVSVGVICLGLFVFWQRQQARQGKPSLMRMGVLTRRIFLVGLSIGTLHTLISTGVMFNLYQFIPAVVGLNPFQTALAVLPYTIVQLVILVLLVKRRPQVSPLYVLQVGLGIKSLGILLLFRAISPTMHAGSLLVPLIVMGLGGGLFAGYITSLTFAAAQANEKAEARGVYRPFQNLGQSLGRAILGTLLITLASVKIVNGVIVHLDQTVSAETRRNAIIYLQRAIQTFTKDEMQTLWAKLPAQVQPQLDNILNQSAVAAMQTTLVVIFILSLVCLGLSFFLPRRVSKFEAPME